MCDEFYEKKIKLNFNWKNDIDVLLELTILMMKNVISSSGTKIIWFKFYDYV